jgi:hypothetical protein
MIFGILVDLKTASPTVDKLKAVIYRTVSAILTRL